MSERTATGSTPTEPTPQVPDRTPREILLDIRTIIGALFGVYGVVCLIWGLAFNGAADRARSGDVNVNLWTGIGMLIFGIGFAAWALMRPLVPPDEQKETEEALAAGDDQKGATDAA